MDVVKLLRQMSRQASISVAREEQSRAASQHAFVGRHPLDAQVMGDCQRFVRYAAFRRPHALGTQSKDFLVQIKSALQLLPRIFRMAKSVLRQGQARGRHRPGIRIAHQWQNRVIERRRRKLDRSFLRRLGMRRKHARPATPAPAQSRTSDHRASSCAPWISAAMSFSSRKNSSNHAICDKHLQVGEILRLKISFRALRMVPMRAKAVP